jgi:hypothetical protein
MGAKLSVALTAEEATEIEKFCSCGEEKKKGKPAVRFQLKPKTINKGECRR